MSYKSLEQCISDLDLKGELLRINREVNPDLEMASIHLDEFAKGGKALFFENIKGKTVLLNVRYINETWTYFCILLER